MLSATDIEKVQDLRPAQRHDPARGLTQLHLGPRRWSDRPGRTRRDGDGLGVGPGARDVRADRRTAPCTPGAATSAIALAQSARLIRADVGARGHHRRPSVVGHAHRHRDPRRRRHAPQWPTTWPSRSPPSSPISGRWHPGSPWSRSASSAAGSRRTATRARTTAGATRCSCSVLGSTAADVYREVARSRSGSPEEGDLKVTMDYRSVLYEVVKSRFPGGQSVHVVPGLLAGAGRRDGRGLTSDFTKAEAQPG